MSVQSGKYPNLARRAFLSGLGGFALLQCGTMLSRPAMAQTTATSTGSPRTTDNAGAMFDFEALTNDMRVLAQTAHAAPAKATGFFSDFTYDDYQAVQFNPKRARWSGPDAGIHLHAFHLGWLFAEPVTLFEIDSGLIQPIVFLTDDFLYYDRVKDRVPAHEPLPGVAGFRLNAPINSPDRFDEVIAFLGASYFRAVGRDTGYGLSARGLAINTGLGQPEEFPRFSRFWIEKPVQFARSVTVFAALESESCTGAYRFVITLGADTQIDVTARLFFRSNVEQMGIAPLTSMFLFSEKNRADFDDFRPNVHDSDGLVIHRHDGDTIWRPLNNPVRLSESWFTEESPKSFGLIQRDRNFENYQDAVSHYERRPSLVIEPLGDWGRGAVRLVEIPSRQEVNDNIVAFWVPAVKAEVGEMQEFSYRMHWGAQSVDPLADIAYVLETRAGVGGVSGVDNTDGTRKFVVDFAGGMLASLPPDAKIESKLSISGGSIAVQTLSKIENHGVWRLVLDVLPDNDKPVELNAHIAGYGRKLTEIWSYQWVIA